jgi:Ssp1 endopeptidase immunity protein Rap1a
MITVDLTEETHVMRRSVWIIGLVVCLWPLLSRAQARDEFLVRHTQDYVRVCSTSPNDPLYAAAMGFCHGYAVGAYHYYLSETAGPQGKPFVCPPEPPPSRSESLTMFIAWAQQHPEYMGERPVDSLFRFLTEKWPCRR